MLKILAHYYWKIEQFKSTSANIRKIISSMKALVIIILTVQILYPSNVVWMKLHIWYIACVEGIHDRTLDICVVKAKGMSKFVRGHPQKIDAIFSVVCVSFILVKMGSTISRVIGMRQHTSSASERIGAYSLSICTIMAVRSKAISRKIINGL